VVSTLGRHVQLIMTHSVIIGFHGSAQARLPTSELFLIIPMHMMNRELIPGR